MGRALHHAHARLSIDEVRHSRTNTVISDGGPSGQRSIGKRDKTYSAWVDGARFNSESVRQRGVNRCRRGVVAEATSSRREMGTNRVSWQVAFSRLRIGRCCVRQLELPEHGCLEVPQPEEIGLPDITRGLELGTLHAAVPGDTLVPFRQSVYCPTVVITSALACCSSLTTTNLPQPTGPDPSSIRRSSNL